MAILKVVAVKDLALGGFMRPFCVPALGMATRSFRDEVNRRADDNGMFNHPADFELYHLADFDEETGAFVQVEPGPFRLSRGSDVKEV